MTFVNNLSKSMNALPEIELKPIDGFQNNVYGFNSRNTNQIL